MYFYCIFFFFKQKTAYEMRISDWSSDVCSSDLRPIPALPSTPISAVDTLSTPKRMPRSISHASARGTGPAAGRDRKSDVEGKSVSVRVDLGGRRLIIKKNTH